MPPREPLKAQLQRLISATQQARDNATRAAELSEEIGGIEVALDLKRLAALYDALLNEMRPPAPPAPEEPPAGPETAAGG